MRTDDRGAGETPLPASFTHTITSLYGAAGAAWLARLPALLDACARRWALTLAPPFAQLSYNYVAPATRADGTALVLKAGVPNPELQTEIAALQIYEGRGSVRLLDADPALGVLLLERLTPGTTLAQVRDDAAATLVAAQLMRRLWRPLPAGHPFPTVAKWAGGLGRLRQRFDGGTGPLPAALVERAERLFADLLASQAAPMLLHGDLHHANILTAEREQWLAIDPKGLAGEAAYEVGAFLRNPLPQLLALPRPGRVLARRVDLLAEALGFERERIVGWALAQAVLSAWWSIEDHGTGWEQAITVAELLAEQDKHYFVVSSPRVPSLCDEKNHAPDL